MGSTVNNTTPQNLGVSLPGVRQGGFQPYLFAVPSGSYATLGGNFGAGVTPVGNYSTITLPTGTTTLALLGTTGPPFITAWTQASYRITNGVCSFQIVITLNRALANPIGSAGEVRLGCAPLAITSPPSYLNTLPPALNAMETQKLMYEVGVRDRNNVNLLIATASSSRLGCRLLADGNIALVQITDSAAPATENAITVAQVTALLAQASPPDVVQFVASGSYQTSQFQ
jgi:hypothetical protein